MNSRSTTFPRNELRVTDCPVNPLELTVGSVKSGALLDCDSDGVEEYVTERVDEVGVGWVKE